MKRKRSYGFTLAEVLITLAIIGVVAALSIPAVISNSQQQEFKTGLRKAVSVLNSAITMNMALDGESPYDNVDLYNYLMRHMSILKSTSRTGWYSKNRTGGSLNVNYNSAFYTTDGMRFEFEDSGGSSEYIPLYESTVKACPVTFFSAGKNCGGCGSYGLKTNDITGKPPCFILVDVNGDKKPTPANINCAAHNCASTNEYIVPVPKTKKVGDIFLILITEEKAVPYGVTAQKAMYHARK